MEPPHSFGFLALAKSASVSVVSLIEGSNNTPIDIFILHVIRQSLIS